MRRRTVVVGLVAAAVASGLAVNEIDARTEPYGPTSVSADLGEDVRVHPYLLHVSGAVAGERLVEPGLFEPREPLTTDGVWVVVGLSYATTDEPRIPFGSGLVVRDGRGREYPVSLRAAGDSWMAGADTWVRGDLIFEVAPDSLDGLELVFAPQSPTVGPMPYRYAVVPLGLAAADLRDQVEVGEPEVLGEGER